MEEMLLKNLLSNGVGGMAGDVPVILLMWMLLKELRAWMPRVDARLQTLETNSINTATTATEVANLKARVAELKSDQKDELEHVRDRLTLIESEQKAVWRKVGDRPSDRAS